MPTTQLSNASPISFALYNPYCDFNFVVYIDILPTGVYFTINIDGKDFLKTSCSTVDFKNRFTHMLSNGTYDFDGVIDDVSISLSKENSHIVLKFDQHKENTEAKSIAIQIEQLEQIQLSLAA